MMWIIASPRPVAVLLRATSGMGQDLAYAAASAMALTAPHTAPHTGRPAPESVAGDEPTVAPTCHALAGATTPLLDSGNGRKLERYGPCTVVPEPNASGRRACKAWGRGRRSSIPPTGRSRPLALRAKPIRSFHWPPGARANSMASSAPSAPGLLPEQAANWGWQDERVRAFAKTSGRQPRS
jgi:hypothetical protein